MGAMSRQPGDLRPRPPDRPGGGPPLGAPDRSWRWALMVVLAVVALAIMVSTVVTAPSPPSVPYTQFITWVKDGNVKEATVNAQTGAIQFTTEDGTTYQSAGPGPGQDNTEVPTLERYLSNGKSLKFVYPSGDWTAILPYVFYGLIFFVFIGWMLRRAQGQMGGIMSIGRSRAKVYTTERPRTTFADVAGYEGVKMEIREVVDFLRSSTRFKEIGARIPKGVLLVGPPGTGKTLLARAVAGEAGVPFMSVTGSDFMEMFVGVGASRVRDLFQSARKQAPAIIFIDEIDSIGRKRGAGLGGGHDEREQTLNRMLAEMDGFEATEGIVRMAATNRPDLDERLPILKVHCKDKRIAPDVDLTVVARGTPGMSGADLANLVNEAALHAVRRGAPAIAAADFDAARDRILMGQRRESTVLSDKEKVATAYHEGGHAVLAYVLPDADPVHKVTILPTGMALGVTQQLPIEERHTYWREYIEDSLCVMMGGRTAEQIVFGTLSTGGSNDLQRATEMARKMVREFGMSERIGPMAWGSGGEVFLGEDLMHSRDYSDETARVVDEEVERILREQEARAMRLLREHREGLAAVAQALMERETIDGTEVARLVDAAYGRPVHEGVGAPSFAIAAAASNGGSRDPEASPGEAPVGGPVFPVSLQSTEATGQLGPH